MTSSAPRPVTRLLVANRGEIACRIFRTAHAMGIASVAVYAPPDAGAKHVREADLAVPLRGSTVSDTYLDVAQVIAAAKAADADAVHPGYGFLAENAEFAEAVLAAGLTWVGPDPGPDPTHGLQGRVEGGCGGGRGAAAPVGSRGRGRRRGLGLSGVRRRIPSAGQGFGGWRRQGDAPGRGDGGAGRGRPVGAARGGRRVR